MVKGTISLIIAALMFAMSGVFNRMVGDSAGSFTAVLGRSLIPAILFGVGLYFWNKRKNRKIQLTNKEKKILFFRSILTIIDFITVFIAFNQLSLGIAILVFYTTYLVSSFLFGQFVLKERISQIELIALIPAIVGLILVMANDFDSKNLEYIVFAIIPGLAYALNIGLSKPLGDRLNAFEINFYSYFITAIFAIPIFFATLITGIENITTPISNTTIYGFILIGINTFITFLLTIIGYLKIDIQKASLILLSEIVWTFILGLIFYNEEFSILGLIGSFLIIFALALPNLFKKADTV